MQIQNSKQPYFNKMFVKIKIRKIFKNFSYILNTKKKTKLFKH